MDNRQVTAEWIAKQRAVCAKANEQIFSMEKARAEAAIVFELFAAALDALEASMKREAEKDAIIASLTAERDAVKESNNALESDIYNNELNLQTLTEQIVRITAERDAAIRDLKWLSNEYKFCTTCKRDNGRGVWDCNDERCDAENHYDWRGLCAENAPTGAESE